MVKPNLLIYIYVQHEEGSFMKDTYIIVPGIYGVYSFHTEIYR